MQKLTLTVALLEGCDVDEYKDLKAILTETQERIHLWSDNVVACLECNMPQAGPCRGL